jgi:hypothetical protein
MEKRTSADAGRTYAPWTPEQVELLNNYQTISGFHPFTCGSGECSHVALVAHDDGWHCPSCEYTQDWAYNFMTRPFRNPRPQG